jgi:hypothetical protein
LTEPLHGAAATGPRPVPVVQVASPPPSGPQRHRLRWEETGASGRTGRTPEGWTLDRWTPHGRTLDGWTPDGRTAGPRTTNPGDRTPDGAGHRTGCTPDGWTAGHRTTEPDGWTPHAGRGPATDAMAGVALSRTATVPARWTLPWADASGRATNQDSSAARTTRGITLYGRGLTTATTGSCSGGATSPDRPRLGALLSSEDFGLSVERTAKLHPLWRVSSRRYSVAGFGGGLPGWAAGYEWLSRLAGAVVALRLDLSRTIHYFDDGQAFQVGNGQLGAVCGDCPRDCSAQQCRHRGGSVQVP